VNGDDDLDGGFFPYFEDVNAPGAIISAFDGAFINFVSFDATTAREGVLKWTCTSTESNASDNSITGYTHYTITPFDPCLVESINPIDNSANGHLLAHTDVTFTFGNNYDQPSIPSPFNSALNPSVFGSSCDHTCQVL